MVRLLEVLIVLHGSVYNIDYINSAGHTKFDGRRRKCLLFSNLVTLLHLIQPLRLCFYFTFLFFLAIRFVDRSHWFLSCLPILLFEFCFPQLHDNFKISVHLLIFHFERAISKVQSRYQPPSKRLSTNSSYLHWNTAAVISDQHRQCSLQLSSKQSKWRNTFRLLCSWQWVLYRFHFTYSLTEVRKRNHFFWKHSFLSVQPSHLKKANLN